MPGAILPGDLNLRLMLSGDELAYLLFNKPYRDAFASLVFDALASRAVGVLVPTLLVGYGRSVVCTLRQSLAPPWSYY